MGRSHSDRLWSHDRSCGVCGGACMCESALPIAFSSRGSYNRSTRGARFCEACVNLPLQKITHVCVYEVCASDDVRLRSRVRSVGVKRIQRSARVDGPLVLGSLVEA